jgi:hypothetical protein
MNSTTLAQLETRLHRVRSGRTPKTKSICHEVPQQAEQEQPPQQSELPNQLSKTPPVAYLFLVRRHHAMSFKVNKQPNPIKGD